MAAQRAVTETARAWHSQLAENFAERAIACSGVSISIGITAPTGAVALNG